MYAAWYGRTDVVKILLENGADINAQSNYGQLHNIIIIQGVSIETSFLNS